MSLSAFSKVLLALIVHPCVAEIVVPTSTPEHLDSIYKAGAYILTTCYGDLNSTVGVVEDSDGSILKALSTNQPSSKLISVALVDATVGGGYRRIQSRQHKLQAFIVAAKSLDQYVKSILSIAGGDWWSNTANFVVLDTAPDPLSQCDNRKAYLGLAASIFGAINLQFICLYRPKDLLVYTANPFTRRAPTPWRYAFQTGSPDMQPVYGFIREYRQERAVCENLNFAKTSKLDGYTISYIAGPASTINSTESTRASQKASKINSDSIKHLWWMIETIAMALNATVVLSANYSGYGIALYEAVALVTDDSGWLAYPTENFIYPPHQLPLIGVTQHTGHMSQLEKIFSVTDKEVRIGIGLVYLITFLFFKFFVRQAAVPSILNLVRLTCNTSLPTLPKNVASTIYLTSLFMFVITFQAIYTGNLATLLTTVIPYPNVQTLPDIVRLGYTAYTHQNPNLMIKDRAIKIPHSERCAQHVLRDPLAVCIVIFGEGVIEAQIHKLHLSREPMSYDWAYHRISLGNPLESRLDTMMKGWFENCLGKGDGDIWHFWDWKYVAPFVDDDEVKKNTERRVMTLDDLGFAFVILGIGLSCSLISFIGEIAIYRIRLKIAKRRGRARTRLAWGIPEKPRLSFPSLKLRFNVRRLFSKNR